MVTVSTVARSEADPMLSEQQMGFPAGSLRAEAGGTPQAPVSLFILMGKTGSGKSTFVKLLGGKDLKGQPPKVHGGTESCTQKPILYTTVIEGNNVLLLDTPGFDDSTRDNLDVLIDIVSHLYAFALRRTEIEVRGVIFLHDICETRMSGSQKKTLEILKALCGDGCMGHVIVGTTMWNEKESGKFANEEIRENEFRKKYWKGIHSTARLQENDGSAARQIALDLLALPPVFLLVQEEMMRSPHTVENTTVRRLAVPDGHAEIEKLKSQQKAQEESFQAELQQLKAEFKRKEEEMKKAAESQRKEAEEEALRLEGTRLRQEEKLRRNYEEAKNKYNEQLRMRAEEEEKRELQRQQADDIQRFEEAMERKREREEKDREDENQRRREFEEEMKKKTEEAEKKAAEVAAKVSGLEEVLEKMTAPPDLAWYQRTINSVVTFFGFRPIFEKVVRKTEEVVKKTEELVRSAAAAASSALS